MKTTKKQLEVLVLRAQGLSNKQIAHKLGIDVSAVRDRIKRVIAKCGASDLVHAIAILIAEGAIVIEDNHDRTD